MSHSPYGHKISAYVLLKIDKILLLKTKELGVLLYVVNTHPVIKIKTTVINIELSVACINNCTFGKTVGDIITHLLH
jgi:hypothetical protein